MAAKKFVYNVMPEYHGKDLHVKPDYEREDGSVFHLQPASEMDKKDLEFLHGKHPDIVRKMEVAAAKK